MGHIQKSHCFLFEIWERQWLIANMILVVSARASIDEDVCKIVTWRRYVRFRKWSPCSLDYIQCHHYSMWCVVMKQFLDAGFIYWILITAIWCMFCAFTPPPSTTTNHFKSFKGQMNLHTLHKYFGMPT